MKTTVVTSGLLRATDEIDQIRFDLFVAASIKSNLRARNKADDRGRGLWFGKTDEECIAAAVAYCECYKHQFRIFVPVNPQPVFTAVAA